MKRYHLLNAYIGWNPGTDQVALVPWPDRPDIGRLYRDSWGACNAEVHKLKFEDRKKMAFITAMHMIVRDKCDPQAVHHALLELEEYEDGCADDMPGIYKRRRPVKPRSAAESCEQFRPDGVRSHTARTSHTSLD